MAVEATVLGGKWLHGHSTVEGGTTYQMRGGICDNGTVQMRKCTIEQYTTIRAMQPEGSKGRIMNHRPILGYLEELKKEGNSLSEVPRLQPLTKSRKGNAPVQKRLDE